MLTLLPGHGGHFSLNETHLGGDGASEQGDCCGGVVEREVCLSKIAEIYCCNRVFSTKHFFVNR